MNATLSCPACGGLLTQAGYTERCNACDGAWVHEDALVGMLQERASSLVFLPWQPRPEDKPRACPVCGTAMQTANLGSVALDRCAAHGVWCDCGELPSLLKEAKHFKAHGGGGDDDDDKSEHKGLLGALAKLFGG